MTAAKQFKILEVLEPVLGREKASEFTEHIEEIVDEKIHLSALRLTKHFLTLSITRLISKNN